MRCASRCVAGASAYSVVPTTKGLECGGQLDFRHPQHVDEYNSSDVSEAVSVRGNELAAGEALAQDGKESVDAVAATSRQLRYLLVSHNAGQGLALERGVGVT